jgi:hypothetical protein
VNRIFKREFALTGQQQDGERSDRIGSWDRSCRTLKTSQSQTGPYCPEAVIG